MKKLLLFLFVVASIGLHAQSTDTFVARCASQPVCTLASNVDWASGNQVWRFTAWQQNESMRIWILNRNTSSAHTSQTVKVFVTDDATTPSLLSNADRWVQAAITDNSVTNAKCVSIGPNAPTSSPGANGKATCYVVGMYAVQIAIQITGAATAAGSPDTFDIGIVQQPSTYPGGPQPGDTSEGGAFTYSSTTLNDTSPMQNGFGTIAGAFLKDGNGLIKIVPTFGMMLGFTTNLVAERLRSVTDIGDGGSTGILGVGANLFNGSTWDRLRSAPGTIGVASVSTESTKATYHLAGFVTPAATPTDVINFQGSGTKTIRITRIAIFIESTAGGIIDVVVSRRSAANTGGTSSSPTIAKHDTADAAATAIVLVYTANAASVGATAGNLAACKTGFVTSGSPYPCVIDYSIRNSKGIVLRGTSDFLSINGNGDTLLAGEVWSYDIEWTEE